jgi:hypothetical protein
MDHGKVHYVMGDNGQKQFSFFNPKSTTHEKTIAFLLRMFHLLSSKLCHHSSGFGELLTRLPRMFLKLKLICKCVAAKLTIYLNHWLTNSVFCHHVLLKIRDGFVGFLAQNANEFFQTKV